MEQCLCFGAHRKSEILPKIKLHGDLHHCIIPILQLTGRNTDAGKAQRINLHDQIGPLQYAGPQFFSCLAT